MLADNGWQAPWRFDAQLFIDIESAEHDFDIADRHSEFLRQESNHVIGRLARSRRGGDADHELIAFRLADGAPG